MAHGGKREGAGRPKGATSKKTKEIADKAVKDGITPLEYMLSVLRDPNAEKAERAWAAEKAAPYIHPRLSTVQHGGDQENPLRLIVETGIAR